MRPIGPARGSRQLSRGSTARRLHVLEDQGADLLGADLDRVLPVEVDVRSVGEGDSTKVGATATVFDPKSPTQPLDLSNAEFVPLIVRCLASSISAYHR